MAYYNSGPWRGTWALEGSGVLSNQCIHDINRLQELAGPVAEVTSCTLANVGHPGTEVEDACIAALRFENGAFGLFTVTLYTQPSIRGYQMIGNLGCYMAEIGLASPEDIDTAMELGLNYPRGPLSLIAQLSEIQTLSLLEILQETTGEDRYRPTMWLRRRAMLGLPIHTES